AYREAHQLAELVAAPAGLQQVPMPPETLTELQPLLQQEPWLRTTLHAVLDNLDQEGFDTQALAEESHMTVTQLQRRLKQTVDLSPARLIRQLRLQYALDLLHQGQDNLGTIAHKAGFFDQAHFSRAFKAQLQSSPKAYRLQHQNGTLWSGMIDKMRQKLNPDEKG
ncbi:MAG TPA: hypothetical protein DCP28_37870, partial [Cytophagales bacterium]|nr:hypothetical protein [Cytophagales bacterium]